MDDELGETPGKILKHLKKKTSRFDADFSLTFEPYIHILLLDDLPCRDFVFEFYYRMSSLQRYFEYTERYIGEYLNDSQRYLQEIRETTKYAEEYDCWSEIVLPDSDYFHEQHYISILTNLFCLLENLLADAAKDVATLSNKKLVLKGGSYIDNYLDFLVEVCPIVIPQENETKIKVMRQIRNRYIHQLGRNISPSFAEELNRMIDTSETKDFKISYQFIDAAFQVVADIAIKIIKGIAEYSENLPK